MTRRVERNKYLESKKEVSLSDNIFFPNTTQIPNFVLDKLMCKYSKTPARFFVLLAIIRKTYGWQKHEDLLSLSQIILLTGLSKNAVKDALKYLQKEKLIKLLSKGSGRKISRYRCLVYEYMDTQRVNQSYSEGQSMTPTESISYPLEGQSMTPQKQLNQLPKSINKKEEQIPFPSQSKFDEFKNYHERKLGYKDDAYQVDVLATKLDYSTELYDKVLEAKNNSDWLPRRNQPNNAKYLLKAFENETLGTKQEFAYINKSSGGFE